MSGWEILSLAILFVSLYAGVVNLFDRVSKLEARASSPPTKPHRNRPENDGDRGQ